MIQQHAMNNGLLLPSFCQLFFLISKRKYVTENIFGQYFKNTNEKSGWSKISQIFESLGSSKIIPVSLVPTKSDRQPDTQNTPFMFIINDSTMSSLWNICSEQDLFLNNQIKEDFHIAIDYPQIKARRLWENLLSLYESIYEIENLANYLYVSILQYADSEEDLTEILGMKSPIQLLFYSDECIHGSFFTDWFYEGLHYNQNQSLFVYGTKQCSNILQENIVLDTSPTLTNQPEMIPIVNNKCIISTFGKFINIMKNNFSNIWYINNVLRIEMENEILQKQISPATVGVHIIPLDTTWNYYKVYAVVSSLHEVSIDFSSSKKEMQVTIQTPEETVEITVHAVTMKII